MKRVLGLTGGVREEEQRVSPCRSFPPLSLTLIFTEDIVHVDSETRRLIFLLPWLSKAFVFIVSILIIVRVPVSLFLWFRTGLSVIVVIVVVSVYISLRCGPSLQSNDL